MQAPNLAKSSKSGPAGLESSPCGLRPGLSLLLWGSSSLGLAHGAEEVWNE